MISLPDFHVFHRYAANFPWISHAVWLLTQMLRWGQLSSPVDVMAAAQRVYRPDLYREAARAVEEGLPLIRAANNGVSAAFDAYGRQLAQLDINVRGTFDVALPVALQPPPYARLGEVVFLAVWFFGVTLVGGVVWRQ